MCSFLELGVVIVKDQALKCNITATLVMNVMDMIIMTLNMCGAATA